MTLCGRLVQEIEQKGGYQKLGAMFARQYKAKAFERFYALTAFDNMELSTQALMFDLIQQGISVEILDERDQFLRLQFGEHVEYVKNGNMTSKDSYISPLIMENKVVTKKVLEKAGFNVPQSQEFTSVKQAIAGYSLFEKERSLLNLNLLTMAWGLQFFSKV